MREYDCCCIGKSCGDDGIDAMFGDEAAGSWLLSMAKFSVEDVVYRINACINGVGN